MQASRQPMPMQMQDFDPDMSDPFNTPGDAGADPMMRMMQQMMAQAGGQQQQGSQGAMNEDPMMKLMHQFMGGEQAQQEQQQPATSVYVWRVVHAIVSTLLALYVGVSTAFNGSEMARTQPQDYVQGFGGVTNNNNNNNNNNGWFGGNNNNNNNNGFGMLHRNASWHLLDYANLLSIQVRSTTIIITTTTLVDCSTCLRPQNLCYRAVDTLWRREGFRVPGSCGHWDSSYLSRMRDILGW